MTVLTTAPERIALILANSHAEVKNAYYTDQPSVEIEHRPAWVVSSEDGNYTSAQGAQNVDSYEEVYQCEFYGRHFDMGAKDVEELLAREIVAAAITALIARPKLQFDNPLNDPALARLRPLPGVKFLRIRREYAGLYTPQGGDEGQLAWGTKIHVTLSGSQEIPEVLVTA